MYLKSGLAAIRRAVISDIIQGLLTLCVDASAEVGLHQHVMMSSSSSEQFFLGRESKLLYIYKTVRNLIYDLTYKLLGVTLRPQAAA